MTLSVEGLSIRYGRQRAVEAVTLRVGRGEVVAVVGESGSGKSTLAHALAGLLPDEARLDAGTITFAGRQVQALSDRGWTRLRGRQIAFVPQDPGTALNPLLTVRRQITEALRQQGLTEPSAESALIDMGVPDPERILKMLPHELSGGYRQRVLLAMATIGRPALLIADEPTSALDVTVQRTVLDRLQLVVRRDDAALVLITHDLAVAAERADRIVVLRNGRVVEQGATSEVLGNPQREYTRLLLRSTPRIVVPEFRGPVGGRPLLRLTAVSKTYSGRRGTTTAVQDVSLSIQPGRTLGLVGASGCGKSTLARMINLLVEPTTGSIELNGATVSGNRRDFRQQVQLVAQNPYDALDPRMTVEKIIGEPLRAFHVGSRRERRTRVRELLEDVGLEPELADRRPRALSGGQRQRVAIARALALNPSLLVLDEPVSALDVVVQARILELLLRLQQERDLAYLLISHDLAVVSSLSDTIAVMDAGRVVEHGPTAEVVTTPDNPITRSLLEAVPSGGRLSGTI
ncbi:dipeptide ABC transporter ATP-binding protein [Kribbella sp. NPDC004875]|uniref:dipeptide ABC transporter ATP-binding protein n=1 Tax=Kribbella sp. NPDC004875 TaxID=3364107 RepID=UPI0036C2D857